MYVLNVGLFILSVNTTCKYSLLVGLNIIITG